VWVVVAGGAVVCVVVWVVAVWVVVAAVWVVVL
jgi:hypothetical protein